MISYSLILVYIIIILIFYLWRTYKNQQLLKMIPNVDVHIPIIGCLHKAIFKSPSAIFENALLKARQMQKTCVYWIFHFPIILLQDPEEIKYVLTSANCIEKLSALDVFGSDIGNYESLMVAHTKRWLTLRKQFNSSFLPQQVDKMIPQVNKVSMKLAKDFSKLCDKGVIDILPVIAIGMVETTLMTQLNITLDESTIENLATLVHSIMSDWGEILCNYYPFYFWHRLKRFLRVPRKDKKKVERIVDLVSPSLDKQAVTFMKEFEEDGKEDGDKLKKRSEMFVKKLYRLLFNNFLTPQASKYHIFEIILAGSDTTALAISNTLLCLAMNPDIQERSYQEIVSISPDLDDEITIEMINKMEYFDRVVKESLRIIPTVHVIGRKATADINIGQVNVPAGVELLIPIFNLHRSKNIWGPNAEKFDPDHFLPEHVENRHRFSYLPFSGGQRGCIAYKYAEIALRIMTIRLVKHFKFSTKLTLNDLKFAEGLTMILINKHMVVIEKRE